MTSDSELRVTRSRRSLQRSVLLCVSCVMLVAVLRAQDEPPPRPGAPAAQQPGEKAPAETAAPAEQAGEQDAAPKDPAPKAGSSPSPSRFEPTEKVRADFDVSFPVDI